MKIWFTADTHFGHGNVIRYNKRPFSSLSEIDETLIENWNGVVHPNDTVYHLGDFTLHGKKLTADYFRRLNGKIHVVPGGHDRRWNRKYDFFSKSGHPVEVLPPLVTIKVPYRVPTSSN
jgi:calcineurin-like phosphoesterase family protein